MTVNTSCHRCGLLVVVSPSTDHASSGLQPGFVQSTPDKPDIPIVVKMAELVSVHNDNKTGIIIIVKQKNQKKLLTRLFQLHFDNIQKYNRFILYVEKLHRKIATNTTANERIQL